MFELMSSMNINTFLGFLCLVFLTLVMLQDFTTKRIQLGNFLIVIPIGIINWFLIDLGFNTMKLVDVGAISVLVLVILYSRNTIGSGDLMILIVLILFWGIKTAFLLYILSLMLFIFGYGIDSFIKGISIKKRIPLIPSIWLVYIIFLWKGLL